MHSHPNCDEILYVVQGTVEHSLPEGGTTFLTAGDAIVPQRGKNHQAKNTGNVDAVVAVTFNAADRQVENK